MLVLSSVMRPPPPVGVTVPWSWTVAPCLMRKYPAVPVPSAEASTQLPRMTLAPADAADIQSAGNVIDTRSVPVSASPASAGFAPDRISITGAAPMAVS
jgi:hypothetical protein